MFNDSYDHEGFFTASEYADRDAVIFNPLEYVADVTTRGSQYAGDGVIVQVISTDGSENQILLVTRPAKMVANFAAEIGKGPMLRRITKVDVPKSPTGYSWVLRNVNPGQPGRAEATKFLSENPDALIGGTPVAATPVNPVSLIPTQRKIEAEPAAAELTESEELAGLF